MATVDPSRREIRFKIVYYGLALAGKTTSIRSFHLWQPPASRGEVVSRATETERVLSYSFAPRSLAPLDGLAVRLDLWTAPGTVFYDATRRGLLVGVDGVIFVADSQETRHEGNIELLETLMASFEEHRLDPGQVPLVFQYNKRDLPDALPVAQLDRDLNPRGLPSFASVAMQGVGVVDPLRECVRRVIAGQGGPLRRPG